MKLVSIAIMSLFFFGGCTSTVVKDLKSYLGYDEETLLSLKKGVISEKGDTKATIQAIYLNSVDKEYGEGENFFVAVYIADDFDESKNYGLRNPRYTLLLNEKKALKITELDENSDLRKKMPLKSRWNHYYHLLFEKSDMNELKLTFKNHEGFKSELVYQKEKPQR